MATKTLRLQLDVGISGEETLTAVIKGTKGYNVAVTELQHTVSKTGTVIDKQTVAIALQGRTVAETEAAYKSLARELKVPLKGQQSSITVDPLKDQKAAQKELARLQVAARKEDLERARIAKAFDAEAHKQRKARQHETNRLEARRLSDSSTVDASKKASVDRAIAYEKAAITNGAKSIEAFKVAQANKQVENERQTQRKLQSIREKFAAGDTSFMQQQKLRNEELKRFQKRALSLHRQTLSEEKKSLALQKQKAESIRRTNIARSHGIDLSAKQNSLTKRNLRDHKSLVRHVFDVVAGYRLINFGINSMQRGLLAIPKAGIQEQANIAALTGTFGSLVGAKELNFVGDTADRYGLSLEQLETSFTKFAPSAKLAGASLAEVNQIFDDFSAVGAVLHKTPDQMQSIFIALEQMFAKGVVQSEEIKKQLGNQLPAAVEIAAEAMGMIPAEFMKAMEKNEIIASEAVPKIAAMYRKIFAPDKILGILSEQLLANYTRAINQSTELARDLFEASKDNLTALAKGSADALEGLRDNLHGVIQAAELLASLLVTRVLSSLLTVTAATIAAQVANIRLIHSYVGLSGVAASVGRSLGLVVQKLTGIPPQAALVVASTAAIAATYLAMNGASLKYTKQSSAEVDTYKELTREWGEALISQQQTAKDTSEIVKGQREEAVLSAELALLNFDALASKSNGFYVTVGERTVSLASFTEAIWSTMIDRMKKMLGEFNEWYIANNAKTISVLDSLVATTKTYWDSTVNLSNFVSSQMAGAIKGVAHILAEDTLATEDLARRKAKALKAFVGGDTAFKVDPLRKKPDTLDAFLSGYAVIDPAVAITEVEKAGGLIQEAADKAYAKDLANFKKNLEDKAGEAQRAFEKQQLKDKLSSLATEKSVEGAGKAARAEEEYQKALLSVEEALLKVTGQTEKLNELRTNKKYAKTEEVLKAKGTEEAQQALKTLDFIKKKEIAQKNAAAAQKSAASIRSKEQEAFNKKLKEQNGLMRIANIEEQRLAREIARGRGNIDAKVDRQIALNIRVRDIQEQQLVLLKKEASKRKDNIDLLVKIAELEEKIALARERALNAIEDISAKAGDRALGIINFSEAKNISTVSLKNDLAIIRKNEALLLDDLRRSKIPKAPTPPLNSTVGSEQPKGAGAGGAEAFTAREGQRKKELAAHKSFELTKTQITEKADLARRNSYGNYALGIAEMAEKVASTYVQHAIRMYGEDSKQARQAFAIYKATMIAKTLIATSMAVMNVWATAPNPIVAGVMSALVAGMGAMQVSQIIAQPMPSAHGGLDYVPKEQTYLLDRGERVLSPNQNKDFTKFMGQKKDNGGQMQAQPAKIRIINNLDPEQITNYLESPDGEQVIVNIWRKNQ